MCGETANPHHPAAYPRIAAAADRRTPYAGSYFTWASFRCVFWRAHDPGRYTGSFRARPAHPALVINNRYDPVTPLRNAVTMSHLLAGSRLLVVNGWGHTAFVQHNRCAERAAARYLISGKLPPSGATCGGGTPPFAASHAR